MTAVYIALGAAALVAATVLVTAYVCFRMAFYAPPRKTDDDTIDIPAGEIYEPFREQMEAWVREVRAMDHEDIWVTSFDGLALHGQYFEFAPDAPVELMFHGYRGNAEHDLSGGVQRCFSLGHSALIVDQRCCGQSEGSVITFGIKEHRDCLAWLAYVCERFGPDVRVILTGISMGAATVMMVADKPLPPAVVGILADCGYTSPHDIIRAVIRQMELPVGVGYFFVKLGARLYGRFDLEACTPLQAVRHACVPVIFIHGETDDFVPCDMSRTLYAACPTEKALFTVPGAGHGLSYIIDNEGYFAAVRAFFGSIPAYTG